MAGLRLGNHILMDESCDTTHNWHLYDLREATKVQEEFDAKDGNFDPVAVFGNLRPGDLVLPQHETQAHYFVFNFKKQDRERQVQTDAPPNQIHYSETNFVAKGIDTARGRGLL